ncbi:MAG: hypothetical protein J5742_01695 [Alphaproteobacteria bacterium]|nr:hypothetical protein [Alphaproteobacteria bacterium]
MKKLLIAGLASVIGLSAANARSMTIYDVYGGMDLGLGSMSYVDLNSDESKYVVNSTFLMGFDLGAKFRPLESVWNPGVSLGVNMTFPAEPEKWGYTKQKPSYTFYTWGADFDNYFAIANRRNAAARTDLIAGIGVHSVTTSYVGGGLGSGSDTYMSVALKFGIDQGISESLKLTAKMQLFILPGNEKGEEDMFFKMSIGFKTMF